MSATRKRNPAASREAILAAAERVFARDGYQGTSLQAIGREAGVSAALPAYFYGDKAGIYDATLARLFAARDQALGPLCERALSTLEGPGDPRRCRRAGLQILVEGYLDFLHDRPTFVALLSREALEPRGRATSPRHSAVFQLSVERVVSAFAPASGAAVDVRQLVVSTIALCFFPVEHDATMLAGMGFDTSTTDFRAARARHVVDLLSRALEH